MTANDSKFSLPYLNKLVGYTIMYSTHDVDNSGIAKRFLKTLKAKIYKK